MLGGMRAWLRAAVLVVAGATVVASCGTAPLTMPALLPLAGAPIRTEALGAASERSAPVETAALAVAAANEPALLHKVVLKPEPEVATKLPAAAANVGPMKHVWQSLNNCGPATVTMILSTMGIDADQETARLALRGPDLARGMGPAPVDPWLRELYGVRALWRNNGTHGLMKALVSNGFAPMVTQWLEDPWVSRISHWRAVQGYDDARGVFQVYDPMRGRIALPYEWFDRNWQPFSYRYLVIYRPEQEPLLRAILGPDWSERAMREHYFQRARAEAAERNDSPSWLAYGEAAYQNGAFGEAVAAFEKGLALGSAQGVFTLRSSYPRALAALGRQEEAARAQRQLGPALSAPAFGSSALVPAQFVIERARLEGIELAD